MANTLRAALRRLWGVLHARHIGVPFLLLVLSVATFFALTPKAAAPQPGVPGVVERAWARTGLPVKTQGRGGFMGHGGIHLPTAFLLCMLFGATWALFALVIRRMESRDVAPDRHVLVSALRLVPVRMMVFPVTGALLIALAGDYLVGCAPLFALYFAFLTACGIVRWARRRKVQDGGLGSHDVRSDRDV